VITDAAMRLFLERSFDEVTIAEIAEAADVSINTVFNYFPTKEDLFFGSHANNDAWLAGLAEARKTGESVIGFMRRDLEIRIEQLRQAPMTLAEFGYWAAVRRVFQESPALRVYAAQAARREVPDMEHTFVAALARDVSARADDLTPRLVAAQVIAIYSTLFLEAERRRRAGEKPEKIHAILRASSATALNLLEKGIGTYGAKPR
jgi:AcrR family transcriptional regulator